MKITICHPLSFVRITGSPALETFELTPRMLRAWNLRKFRAFEISCNENVNKANGLPCATARDWLEKLHSDKFGLCNPAGAVTWQDVKRAIE